MAHQVVGPVVWLAPDNCRPIRSGKPVRGARRAQRLPLTGVSAETRWAASGSKNAYPKWLKSRAVAAVGPSPCRGSCPAGAFLRVVGPVPGAGWGGEGWGPSHPPGARPRCRWPRPSRRPRRRCTRRRRWRRGPRRGRSSCRRCSAACARPRAGGAAASPFRSVYSSPARRIRLRMAQASVRKPESVAKTSAPFASARSFPCRVASLSHQPTSMRKTMTAV